MTRAAVFGAVACFAVAALTRGALGWGAALGLAGICAWAVAPRREQVLHLGLLGLLLSAAPRLLPDGLRPWPWRLLLPLLLYATVVAGVPRLRRSVHWVQPGRFRAREACLVAGLVAAAAVGLAGWVQYARPDMALYARNLPALAPWVLVPSGGGFALLNAAMEEAIFRGAILESLDRTLASPAAALVLQAVLFGVLHYRAGFPNGWWGVALTTLYGLALGWLRRTSGGMTAPWVAHAGADAAVYALVVRYAAGQTG